jgi:hypothetical protein
MDSNQNKDLFPEQRAGLPGMLNALTILTFIGCAFSYLGTIYSLIQAGNYEKERAKLEDMRDQVGDSGLGAKMMEGSLEIMQKSHEYRYILFASGILFTTLCLIGAMQMRKLKKSGYPIYVFGELAPIVVSAVLIGFSFVGGFTTAIGAVFAILFVILYTTQRKYLVN